MGLESRDYSQKSPLFLVHSKVQTPMWIIGNGCKNGGMFGYAQTDSLFYLKIKKKKLIIS